MRTETIAGLPIPPLANEFGTPVYIYDQAVIEQRVRELKSFGSIRFAMKSCPNLAILALMKKLGCVVDCVSEGELMRAIKAGFSVDTSPSGLAYTCDIFDHDSLKFVIENTIPVNIGSTDMIHQYGLKSPRKGITIRVNPGFGHGHSHKTNTGGPSSKHGIWHEEIPAVISAVEKYGMHIEGLHMHIGSGTDFEHLSTVCSSMLKIARQIGPCLNMISAGGGLPIPYKSDEARIDMARYQELWWEVRDQLQKDFGHEIELELEPGRYLTAESGSLLTEIRAIKKMGDNTFYLVDAGFNNLARPVMYGAYHGISICRKDGKQDVTSLEVVVGGPLCESGDVFTQLEGGIVEPRTLPEATVGDYLIIHDTGAYGAAMGSNYNSKPHCPEILIHEGKAHTIRQKQKLEELYQSESIPTYLQ